MKSFDSAVEEEFAIGKRERTGTAREGVSSQGRWETSGTDLRKVSS